MNDCVLHALSFAVGKHGVDEVDRCRSGRQGLQLRHGYGAMLVEVQVQTTSNLACSRPLQA